MKVLIDTCVILDALEERGAFKKTADAVMLAHTDGLFNGYVTAKSIMDIYYLLIHFFHDGEKAKHVTRNLLKLVPGLDTLAEDCLMALHGEMRDCEDGLMVQTALREGMDGIVTRNIRDYQEAPIRIYSPEELLSTVGAVNWG